MCRFSAVCCRCHQTHNSSSWEIKVNKVSVVWYSMLDDGLWFEVSCCLLSQIHPLMMLVLNINLVLSGFFCRRTTIGSIQGETWVTLLFRIKIIRSLRCMYLKREVKHSHRTYRRETVSCSTYTPSAGLSTDGFLCSCIQVKLISRMMNMTSFFSPS